ncbi:RNA polymerase sigma factor [Chitinophaga sedimenti]|uniref:RNA polymerase sigma factor n=1 Tax=Chitinophaga sedimenti TaxID=2033606 RepID=UPI0020060FEF|nr:sigma-70 family RNA polymerase sigma factor [Chitinophaga sedimenti]MCK7553696.1 RNA polymerase sigma factor [Chitinophaga sedimenti]
MNLFQHTASLTIDVWQGIHYLAGRLATNSLLNEHLLVRAAADGDQQAYAQLYIHYYPSLQAAINFITNDRDETDELLQETFFRIWKLREKLLLVRSFEHYAFTIARNLLFDLLRRKKVHLRALESLAQQGAAATPDQLEYKELHELANGAINSLDPQKRDIFLLRTEEGLSFEEIAAKYGLAVVTVKKHYYAAYHALKSLLEQHGGPLSLLLLLWFEKR